VGLGVLSLFGTMLGFWGLGREMDGVVCLDLGWIGVKFYGKIWSGRGFDGAFAVVNRGR